MSTAGTGPDLVEGEKEKKGSEKKEKLGSAARMAAAYYRRKSPRNISRLD